MVSPESLSLEGGCACGQVRYQLTAKPLFIHCCHCTCCQRETGSAFALNAMIEAKYVVSTGPIKPYVARIASTSGRGQKVLRCPECQVAVWSNYEVVGDLLRFVRAGTLDDPNLLGGPSIHIFTSTKQKWVDLSQSPVPVVAEGYNREDYWPKESLERRAALLEEAKRASQN